MPAETASERGRQTRQRLVAAAIELIPEVGWAAVTTRRVAERAGVRPGLVHYHFDSVASLLTTAAVEFAREALGTPLRELRAASDPADGLVRLLAALDAYDGRDPGSLLMIEATLAATRDAALRAAFAELLDDFRADVAEWLTGHAVPDAAECAALLCALLDGIVLHRGLSQTPDARSLAGPLGRLLAAPAPTDERSPR
ncbi:TetR/AcrR family transcriptional regulator [Thermobifida halotolerans]|uniref:TetR/AcrR family transcriptional regulator n=1 Tax=Thermobifida halotolerans TaxID=483545 RepID=UPI000A91E0EC|nr:TetR family transcriptional regulator [Thermobifida halotolerans]